jgi:CRISPR/Cas system-associated endonuclease Cas1
MQRAKFKRYGYYAREVGKVWWKKYFATLSALLPEQYKFKNRNQPATDIFNAMLNYAYGILYWSFSTD